MTTRRKVSRWVVGTGIAGTVFIAGLAFWLSFTALTHLAVRAGIAEGQAWAWPLIVDGIIVVATVGVVALRERKGQRYAWMLLISGALVSVTANAVQAAMPPNLALPPALAAAVSAVPPIVLLAITHLTVVLARHEDDHTETSSPEPIAELSSAEVVTDPRRLEGDAVSGMQPVPPPTVTGMKPDTPPSVVVQVEQEPQTTNTQPPTSASQALPETPSVEELPVSAETSLFEAGLRHLLLGIDTETSDSEGFGEGSRTFLVEEAMRLKQEGSSNRVIAERLGVDPSTVGRWLKKHQQGDPSE